MFHKVNEKDDAVSPVIGVMLMLIVTAVIAAVVAVFATGVVSDSPGSTPTAMLEYSGQNIPEGSSYLGSFDIKHEGGDTLSLANILITIEPDGGSNTGIMIPLKGSDLKSLGPNPNLVSAGDILRASIPYGVYSSLRIGVIIKWSLSDIRTNGVLAEGEFVVSNEEI